MVPVFRLMVMFIPAFNQVGERTHSACSGIRPLYTVLIHQKCLTCLNQEGVCVLYGNVLFNLELNGQNLVLLYHQTTAGTLAGFSFASCPLAGSWDGQVLRAGADDVPGEGFHCPSHDSSLRRLTECQGHENKSAG